ncbi:MAG: triose-phosphate isomerase [Candidatus Aenigmarchaeota archaeon]|nr:triose-phosphate isomerase [Candidatus Aenigmarchaeota archaeon]
MKPVILINFKTYESGAGHRALEIAKIADRVAKEKGVNIILAVQAADIRMISDAVSIPVYAQHIDPIEPGSHTGWTLAEDVKEAGVEGTLINHSEHRMEIDQIEKAIDIAKEEGMKTVACAPDAEVAEAISVFEPDFIAVEPPELIAGNISVSEARPQLITKTIEMVRKMNSNIPVLVGAGVKKSADVSKALELGASGVLLSSGVMKSKDPEKEMLELIEGLKR